MTRPRTDPGIDYSHAEDHCDLCAAQAGWEAESGFTFGALSAPAWGTAPNSIGTNGYAVDGDNVFCADRLCIYEGTGFLPF